MALKLKNRTKRLVEVNLDHADFMTSVEHQSVEHNPATGMKGVRVSQRRVFPSVMVLAGETKNFPDGALKAPSVKAAVDRQELREV